MKKILLIEDEEPIRRVLIRILEEENKDYEITQCEDGKLGLITLIRRILTWCCAILKCRKWMV